MWSPLFSLHPAGAPYLPEGFNFDWSVAELPPTQGFAAERPSTAAGRSLRGFGPPPPTLPSRGPLLPEAQRTDDPSADQLVYFSSMPSLAASSEQRKRFQVPPNTATVTGQRRACHPQKLFCLRYACVTPYHLLLAFVYGAHGRRPGFFLRKFVTPAGGGVSRVWVPVC